jgi:acetyltransferase
MRGAGLMLNKERWHMSDAYPPESVVLRDGTAVTIRAIRPDDARRLQELFERLSPESIYLRFLEQRKAVSNREAERLATVDYDKQMALVATRQENDEEHIIGVARYSAIDSSAQDSAEAAIVVEDRFQGKGLGTLLADRLVKYARTHGIQSFLAEVSIDNMRMIQFIRRTGLPVKSKRDTGVWELRVDLE